MSRRPTLFPRNMYILAIAAGLATLAPAAAASPGVMLRNFTVGERRGDVQSFQIVFDQTSTLRVHDELVNKHYFYLDFYDAEQPNGNRDWSPGGDGVYHIKQIYYPAQRVLRFVFYCRGDAWFSVQTRAGSVHDVQVRPIRYTDLGRVDASLGGTHKRVVVDPGHGGKPADGKHHVGGRTSRKIDGRFVDEKEVTLQVAERLNALIAKAPNLEGVMTRKKDVYVGLEERIEIAQKAQGDLFLSVHMNATGSRAKTARGFEVYFLSDGSKETNRELVALENEGVALDDSLSYRETLRDLIRTLAEEAMVQRQAESRMLCDVISQEFEAAGPFRRYHRGVKSAPFRVLMNFDMPSVLAECGFLDHPVEGDLLTRPDVQQQIAVLLFNGINRYFAMEDPAFRPTRIGTAQ